jgi:asparagine synthase (glutamine-hydrolysing)
LVAAHAERIYRNIDYAISTHSNHTISEAFGLWLVGLLFPELKDSEKYFALGKRLLEQEAAAQIFPDGTYSMYSLNYHRFILHLYLYMIRLAELNQSSRSIPVGPVSSLIINRVLSSIDYLSSLIDPQTGQMPVYGSNDGALVLPLNNCDFTDYRPLLQLGSYVTQKQPLFPPGPWNEDLFWFYGDIPLTPAPFPLERRSFPQGGTYILRSTNSKAVIRCADHRARPSHADQLHVDLWMNGRNITVDAETYLYSGAGPWRNGLAHTAVHNTVTVDHHDQMKMLTRFTWTNWSHGKVLRHAENFWQGEHDGYNRLADPVTHKRTVLSLGEDRWLVVDHLSAEKQHQYSLHWLLNDFPFEQQANSLLLSVDSWKCKTHFGILHGNGNFSLVRADPKSTRGWRSRYYGEREPAISAMLETEHASATFWSFFGFEGDVIQQTGSSLKFNLVEIDLEQLNK